MQFASPGELVHDQAVQLTLVTDGVAGVYLWLFLPSYIWLRTSPLAKVFLLWYSSICPFLLQWVKASIYWPWLGSCVLTNCQRWEESEKVELNIFSSLIGYEQVQML